MELGVRGRSSSKQGNGRSSNSSCHCRCAPFLPRAGCYERRFECCTLHFLFVIRRHCALVDQDADQPFAGRRLRRMWQEIGFLALVVKGKDKVFGRGLPRRGLKSGGVVRPIVPRRKAVVEDAQLVFAACVLPPPVADCRLHEEECGTY